MKSPDLIGQRFSRLVVRKDFGIKNGARWWLAVCDCGKEKRVTTGHLRSGKTRSCGCLRREVLRDLTQQMTEREAVSKRKGEIRAALSDRLVVPEPHAAQSCIPGEGGTRSSPDIKIDPVKKPGT